MSRRINVTWRRQRVVQFVMVLLALALIRLWAESGEPEIALVTGEPWEDMRKRSSASIGPAVPNHIWFQIPKSDARLRFIDPQYGFVTPLARFFAITFDDERVAGIRMSPQIEPLLLDDALAVVLDLQEQWRRGGWTLRRANSFPAFADTPEWRAQLRDVNKGGKAYWRAGDKYQTLLLLHRFRDDKRPTEERYLITLGLHKSDGMP